MTTLVSIWSFQPTAALSWAGQFRPPSAPPHGEYQISRLALQAQTPDELGHAPPYRLPWIAPPDFRLTFDIWTNSDEELSQVSVLGIRLHGTAIKEPGSESRGFHQIRVERKSRRLRAWVDGKPLESPTENESTTQELEIRPAPQRRLIIRNVHLRW
jgi:hypothetical protein